MVEKNYWNKLELEVFLTVVVTAAGRQNGEHMWKQSSSKWLLIASSIGWAMFPNSQQRRLTYCMCWWRHAWVSVFCYLFSRHKQQFLFSLFQKWWCQRYNKVIVRTGLNAWHKETHPPCTWAQLTLDSVASWIENICFVFAALNLPFLPEKFSTFFGSFSYQLWRFLHLRGSRLSKQRPPSKPQLPC